MCEANETGFQMVGHAKCIAEKRLTMSSLQSEMRACGVEAGLHSEACNTKSMELSVGNVNCLVTEDSEHVLSIGISVYN